MSSPPQQDGIPPPAPVGGPDAVIQTGPAPGVQACEPVRWSRGVLCANWFGLFNALSWQITLGAPVVLYAKSQGASATVLGVIASLTPLLVIFQLPAAHLLPKYGYRRFILMGGGVGRS